MGNTSVNYLNNLKAVWQTKIKQMLCSFANFEYNVRDKSVTEVHTKARIANILPTSSVL